MKFEYEIKDINGDIYNFVNKRSYVKNDDIDISELVYIKFNHYNFDNEIVDGELIVNRKIANRVINILSGLFESKYQIKSFKLIDNYFITNDDDRKIVDRRSILDNNSSSFNYRRIPDTNRLSKHSLGLAIDINPFQNPYLHYLDGEYKYDDLTDEELYFVNNRSSNIPHEITHDDICYKLFIENGFKWGGDWEYTKDYQHFEIDLEDL